MDFCEELVFDFDVPLGEHAPTNSESAAAAGHKLARLDERHVPILEIGNERRQLHRATANDLRSGAGVLWTWASGISPSALVYANKFLELLTMGLAPTPDF